MKNITWDAARGSAALENEASSHDYLFKVEYISGSQPFGL